MFPPEILQLTNKAKQAIQYDDNHDALRVFSQLIEFLVSPLAKQLRPDEIQSLETIRIHLMIVAFSSINDADAVDILKHHYLDAFDIESSLESKIIARLFKVPFAIRGEIREQLRKAFAENDQKLGSLTMSQWINDFKKTYNNKKKTEASIVEFINNSKPALLLNPLEKKKLRESLHIYDYYLVYTLPTTEPFLSELLEDLSDKSSEISENKAPTQEQYFNAPLQNNFQQDNNVTSKFNEALGTYHELGEQIITPYRLNLKSFPEPVRPSIKNWITDYTFNVGYDHHDNMVRGDYMFKNPNAKNLSPEDREKLSYILRVFDENAIVTVNTATKQIIFPNVERGAWSAEHGAQNFHPTPPPSQPIPSSIFRQVGHQTPSFHKNIPNQMTIRRVAPSVPASTRRDDRLSTRGGEHGAQKGPVPIHEENHLSPRFEELEMPGVSIKRESQPGAPLNNQTIKPPTFSSPQKMPYEKIQEPARPSATNAIRAGNISNSNTGAPIKTPPRLAEMTARRSEAGPPASPSPSAQPRPYHITSSSSQQNGNGAEKKEILPKNVINLREK